MTSYASLSQVKLLGETDVSCRSVTDRNMGWGFIIYEALNYKDLMSGE